MLTSSSRL
jgi:leukemia factor-related protein